MVIFKIVMLVCQRVILQGRCHQLQQPGQRLRTSTALGGGTRGARGLALGPSGPGAVGRVKDGGERSGRKGRLEMMSTWIWGCCIFVMFLVHRFGNLLFWFIEVWGHCISKDTGYRLVIAPDWLESPICKSLVNSHNVIFPASHVWRRLSYPPTKRRSREKEIKRHQWICGSSGSLHSVLPTYHHFFTA